MKAIFLLICLQPLFLFAQTVGVGTNTPDASAMLDVTSISKGLLIPRMKESEKKLIVQPAHSLLVYQTDVVPGYYYNSGTPGAPVWTMLATPVSSWSLTGNAGTNPATNFLGTTDIQPLRFRIRNIWAGSIDSAKGTYIGFRAGQNDALGNSAFGDKALSTNEQGSGLTAIGRSALEMNRGGHSNTAVGASALKENTLGDWNTAVGTQAMLNNTTANENVAVGTFSMYDNKGENNVGVGVYSLPKNEGDNNVGVGHYALYTNTTGSWNIGVGSSALRNNTTGIGNIGIGISALNLNDTGTSNIGIGSFSLSKNKVDNNTAVGAHSLRENTSGEGNTALGYQTLRNNLVGDKNTALGYSALSKSTTGLNTAVGYNALSTVDWGWDNTAIGVEAMSNADGTARNVAVGTRALRNCTSSPAANGNVAVGYEAALNNALGIDNVAVGTGSMKMNDNGGNNTAVGGFSMNDNISGSGNVALGIIALYNNTVGDYNTAVGYQAGYGNITGNYNTYIGYKANTNGSHLNATAIGYSAYAECGNCMVLGSVSGKNGSNVTVNVGIGTTNPGYRLQVGTAGDGSQARANAWNVFSDERYKTDIEEIPNALDKIDGLHGYYYNWKTGDDKTRQAGLLAQEVEKVLPEIVSTDAEGYKSVEYGKMNALLLQAIKELKDQNQQLRAEVKALVERANK
jgi:hypothetical protein